MEIDPIILAFAIWLVGFVLSIPLSLMFITNNSEGISRDKIDFLIPTSVFLGLVFSWIWMLVMLVLVLRDFIRSFSSKNNTFNNKAFNNGTKR